MRITKQLVFQAVAFLAVAVAATGALVLAGLNEDPSSALAATECTVACTTGQGH